MEIRRGSVRGSEGREMSGSWIEGAPGRVKMGLLALVLLAASAGMALNASGAAALGEQCSGSSIGAQGSYLQRVAENVWATGFNSSGAPGACNGTQGAGGKPKVTYTTVGSGAALQGWGADDGEFHKPGIAFIGTDAPPAGPVGEEGTQLANMKAALSSDLVVAPVAQTAIAVVAHAPALPAHEPCVVGQVTQTDLEAIFSGQLTNWRQLTTASDSEPGGDCDQAITRIVRQEGSGTTYQFKHYLDQVNPGPLECTGETQRTWAQLEPISGAKGPNVEWPRKADCQEGEGPVTVVASPAEGSTGPLGYVQKTAGTITYAGLADAKAFAPSQIVDVYNGLEFVDPGTVSKDASCKGSEYALPAEWAEGLNVDWSQVHGSNPEIAQEDAYPICTLTWVVAAADSGGVFGNKAGTTIRDYLNYAIAVKGGQEELLGNWYAALPEPIANASLLALSEIGGEGEEEELGNAVLCKVPPVNEAGALRCPIEQGYEGKINGSLQTETAATFVSTAGPKGTVSCDQGFFSGEFAEDGTSLSEVGVTLLRFDDSGESCNSTLESFEGPVVELEVVSPSFDASKFVYLSPIAPHGSFVLAKSEGVPRLALRGTKGKCFYVPTFLSGQVVNGSPTRLLFSASWELDEAFGACPEALQQTSNFDLVRMEVEEAPIYVSGE